MAGAKYLHPGMAAYFAVYQNEAGGPSPCGGKVPVYAAPGRRLSSHQKKRRDSGAFFVSAYSTLLWFFAIVCRSAPMRTAQHARMTSPTVCMTG